MVNTVRTYKNLDPYEVSNEANSGIFDLNEKGFNVKQFQAYSRISPKGKEWHFITVLFEK